MTTHSHEGPETTGTPVKPETADAPALSGPVKWFDETRGYGFVLLGQPPRDAFLHMSVLRRDGVDRIVQGDRLSCTSGITSRGLTVLSVLSVERAVIGEPGDASAAHFTGKVKFYDQERGYGFVTLDGCPEGNRTPAEAFVGSKLLKRLGLAPLRADQAVRITAFPRSGGGLVAETLTFLS